MHKKQLVQIVKKRIPVYSDLGVPISYVDLLDLSLLVSSMHRVLNLWRSNLDDKAWYD